MRSSPAANALTCSSDLLPPTAMQPQARRLLPVCILLSAACTAARQPETAPEAQSKPAAPAVPSPGGPPALGEQTVSPDQESRERDAGRAFFDSLLASARRYPPGVRVDSVQALLARLQAAGHPIALRTKIF